MNQIRDTGISVAYEPENGSPIVDIVFVHGLQGHPSKTWTYHPKVSIAQGEAKRTSAIRRFANHLLRKPFKAKLSADTINTAAKQTLDNDTQPKPVVWPLDLIPKECPNSRILMFGYDSKITKYMAGATNQNGVFSHGKDLLFALSRERHLDRPLVFVAHSLGGIIVKQMLAEALSLPETFFLNIVKSTAAVVFLGTPHRGSQDVAALGEVIRSIVGAFGMETSPVNLHALGLKTSDLERAQEDFSKLWQKYDFRVKTFQEGLSYTKLGRKVVPDYSSLIGDHREHAETLQANHLEMCRFWGTDDPNYHKVAGELRSIYHSIARVTKVGASSGRRTRPPLGFLNDSSSNESVHAAATNHDACLESLWFPAIENRIHSVDSPTHRTCSWLFTHPEYDEWFNGESRYRCHGLLWLKGKPGAGKSTLMKEAFRRAVTGQAESNYITAAFFFCANGDELEHKSRGLFRSLLYQLLSRDRPSLQRFQQHCNEKRGPYKSHGHPTETITWAQTELRNLLQSVLLHQTKRTIIFIDGFDECDESDMRSLAYFWRSITKVAHDLGRELNVCLSSRHFPTISLSHCAEIVVEQHNGDDIATYVDQKFQICMSTQMLRWRFLKQRILEKAGGVFLWAVLVVEDVLKEWDNGSELLYLVQRATYVPQTLENLFSNLFSDLDPSMRELTVRFFQWAILSTKPLRLHEWHHIMAFIRRPGSSEELNQSSSPTSRNQRLMRLNSRPAFKSLIEWRQSVHFTESDEQLEKQIRSLSRGLVEIMKVRTKEPQEGKFEVVSMYAGAGSLNLEHGDTRVVQVIHESVRDFFLKGSGFSVLDPSLHNHPIGNGHLLIMATCLDYIHIAELDALVKARGLAAGRKGRTRYLNKTSSSGAQSQHSTAGEQSRPSLKGHQMIHVSNFDTLSSLNPALGIDVVEWLANDGDNPVEWPYPKELPCESDSSSSDGSQLRMLEDYPALLSYATSQMSTHARRAEEDGIDQTPMIERFEDEATRTRWLTLREDISNSTNMRSYAVQMGLNSWSKYYVRDGSLAPSTSELAEDDDGSSDRPGSVASFSSASSHAAFDVRRRKSRSLDKRTPQPTWMGSRKRSMSRIGSQ